MTSPTFFFSVDPTSGEVTCTAFDEYLDVPAEIKLTLSATIPSKSDDVTFTMDHARYLGFSLPADLTAQTLLIFDIVDSEVTRPTMTSTDFGLGAAQTVGYPDFVYLESFIAMPLARLTAAPSDQIGNRSDLQFAIQDDSNR